MGLRDLESGVSADGKVQVVRTDNGGDFGSRSSEFSSVHSIRQGYTPSDRPQYNGAAERAIAFIENIYLAVGLHSKALYPGENVLACPLLYKASLWATDEFNRTSTRANLGMQSLDRM